MFSYVVLHHIHSVKQSDDVRTSAYWKQASDGRQRRCNDDGNTAIRVHARLQTQTTPNMMYLYSDTRFNLTMSRL